jgi:hypothetical protein
MTIAMNTSAASTSAGVNPATRDLTQDRRFVVQIS